VYSEKELKKMMESFDKTVTYENKEYTFKNFVKLGNGKSTSIDSLYNIEHHVKDGVHIVTAAQHYSWDFLVGKGSTIEDALKDLQVVVNMYDPEYAEIKVNYLLK
jgi:hypothetical protein